MYDVSWNPLLPKSESRLNGNRNFRVENLCKTADWTGCPSHICSLPAAMRLATFYRHCVWCACTFVRKYHRVMHQLVAVTLG